MASHVSSGLILQRPAIGIAHDVAAGIFSMRLPTTDALFAQEVEQKVSNLLAGLGVAQSFPNPATHAPRRSLKLLNFVPAHRSSNLTCPGERIRTSM